MSDACLFPEIAEREYVFERKSVENEASKPCTRALLRYFWMRSEHSVAGYIGKINRYTLYGSLSCFIFCFCLFLWAARKARSRGENVSGRAFKNPHARARGIRVIRLFFGKLIRMYARNTPLLLVPLDGNRLQKTSRIRGGCRRRSNERTTARTCFVFFFFFAFARI